MTAAEAEWRVNYAKEVDAAKTVALARGFNTTKKVLLHNLDKSDNVWHKCLKIGTIEAEYNWFNYKPYGQTPEDKRNNIKFGKAWEIYVAYLDRHMMVTSKAVLPTIFSQTPFPKYDYVLDDGTMIDVKASYGRALKHAELYRGVVSKYPVDPNNPCSEIKQIVFSSVCHPVDDIPFV